MNAMEGAVNTEIELLKRLQGKLGVNDPQFAVELGISPAALMRTYKGQRKMSKVRRALLARSPEYSHMRGGEPCTMRALWAV